jgi:hypothetical protein
MSDEERRTEEPAQENPEREPVKITPDGVANRPELRARSRKADDQQDANAEELPDLQEQAQEPGKARPVRKVALPSQTARDDRLEYATHRPPPDEEGGVKSEPQEAESPPGQAGAEGQEREISAPFVLGVVIIVIALILGTMIAGLNSRLKDVERQVAQLDNQVEPPTE